VIVLGVLGILGAAGYVIWTRDQPVAGLIAGLPVGSRIRQFVSGHTDVGDSSASVSEDQPSGPTDGSGALAATSDSDPEPAPSPVERAHAALEEGRPGAAAQIAYLTVRSQFTPTDGDRSTQTHWEFYRNWQDDERVDPTQLQTITEAYEAAMFAPHEISKEVAAAAIDATAELVSTSQSKTDPSDD